MNARAVQSARVTLSDNVDETRHRPVLVNNIVSLNGRLLNPDISFTFTLPDADEIARASVYNMIDTTNREEMIRQMVNVLLMGTFIVDASASNPQGSGTAINTGLYSLSELVSSQINKLVSNLSQNIDFRAVYRPGENTDENELILDLGMRLLKDRLIVRTSFGYLERQDINAQDRFLGDVITEFRLDSNGFWRLKAFNVTNPQDITSTNSSTYSQGVGLSFSKDFDKFKDLFIRKKNKNKKTTTK